MKNLLKSTTTKLLSKFKTNPSDLTSSLLEDHNKDYKELEKFIEICKKSSIKEKRQKLEEKDKNTKQLLENFIKRQPGEISLGEKQIPIDKFPRFKYLNVMKYSQNGKLIATGSREEIKIYDSVTREELFIIISKNAECESITFDLNSKVIFASSYDSIIVFNLNTRKILTKLYGNIKKITSLTSNNQFLVSGSENSEIIIWDKSILKIIKKFTTKESSHNEKISSLAFNPIDDFMLITAAHDNKIIVWDLYKMEIKIKLIDAHNNFITNIQFSKQGEFFASSGLDSKIIFWDTKTFNNFNQIERRIFGITSISISNDANRLLSGGIDGKVILWDIKTGKLLFLSLKKKIIKKRRKIVKARKA